MVVETCHGTSPRVLKTMMPSESKKSYIALGGAFFFCGLFNKNVFLHSLINKSEFRTMDS